MFIAITTIIGVVVTLFYPAIGLSASEVIDIVNAGSEVLDEGLVLSSPVESSHTQEVTIHSSNLNTPVSSSPIDPNTPLEVSRFHDVNFHRLGVDFRTADDNLNSRSQYGNLVYTSDIHRNPILRNIFWAQAQAAMGMTDQQFHDWLNSDDGLYAMQKSMNLGESILQRRD